MAVQSFDEFLAALRLPDSRTGLSAERLADALEMPAQELAGLARVHRNTVLTAPNSPKLQAAMRDVVRVLSAAYAFNGDMDRTLFWFRNHPIRELGHQTAMSLVEDDKVQAVMDYLRSLSVGATGRTSASGSDR